MMKSLTQVLGAARPLAESIFGRYGRELHLYLLRRLRHAEDANDLAQEVYLRLLRRSHEEPVLNPRAYVYRVAAHVVAEFHERATQDRSALTFDSEALEALSESASSAEDEGLPERLDARRQLEKALASLPPTHQAVFLMRKRDGHTHEEIAERLGLSMHTVEKYVVQACAWLRVRISER